MDGNFNVDVWSSLVQSRFDVDGRGAVIGLSADLSSRLQSLDEELLTMGRALSTANKHRNMLVAACRVPAEVLSIIFALAQISWLPSAKNKGVNDNSVVYDYGWIYITHVCSYWREVAVQTSSLWTTNFNGLDVPLEYIPSILRQSKTLPLDLSLGHPLGNLEVPELEEILSTWFTSEHILERIRSLSIGCDEEDFENFTAYVQKPMPHLINLTLQINSNDEAIIRRLPPMLCSGAEHLSTLDLWDCVPRWDSPLLCASLTSLSLHCFDNPEPEDIPTREQFASLLPSLISLQHLLLFNVFPHVPTSNTPTTCIKLPSGLKHLDLEANTMHSRCLLFIPLLTLGPSTKVDVMVKDIERTSQNLPPELGGTLAPMIDPVLSTLYGSRGRTVIELVVATYSLSSFTAELPRSHWTTWVPLHDSTLPADQTSGSSFFRIQAEGSDLALCRRISSLPLHDICAISFHRNAIRDMHKRNYLPTLARAQSVRRLGIDITSSAPLMQALTELRPDGAFAIFPVLEILHVHTGVLGRGEAVPQQSECASESLALADFVAARRNGGSPLKEIVVEQALADWDVWEEVKSDVLVSLFDF